MTFLSTLLEVSNLAPFGYGLAGIGAGLAAIGAGLGIGNIDKSRHKAFA